MDGYCLALGQKINTMKSFFIVGRKEPTSRAITIERIIGYTQDSMDEPFEYLGRPFLQGRTRSSHFSKLLNKTRARIDGWITKFLTMG